MTSPIFRGEGGFKNEEKLMTYRMILVVYDQNKVFGLCLKPILKTKIASIVGPILKLTVNTVFFK